MSRYLRASLGVIVAIAVCAALVAIAIRGSAARLGNVAAAMDCPTTGCESTSCHGATGGTPNGPTATAGSGLLTCPATGCTASTCHATAGGGGRVYGGGYGAQQQPSQYY